MARLCFSILLLGLAGLSAVGCVSHAVHTDYAAFVREPKPSVVGREYRVGVPDVLVVTRLSWDGVSESRHTVGPDGSLWLKDFGTVVAADRSCEQIAAELTERAAEIDSVQAVTVRVERFASRKVYVFGQVQVSGEQSFNGANTVLDVVAKAQPNVRADVKHIHILRPSADGEVRRRLTVDIDAMVRGGDTTLDVVLAEGDIVFVPPTGIGSWGLAWAQLFGESQPEMEPTADTSPRLAAVPPAPVQPAISDEAMDELSATQREQFESLQESLSALHEEVAQLKAEAQATQDAVLAAQHTSPPTTTASESSPTPGGVEFTSADAQRGGVGESASPEGVRFWGP